MNKKENSTYERLEEVYDLNSTCDASVWAREFVNIFKKLYGHNIYEQTKMDWDNFEDWIQGWMANAIMCGVTKEHSKYTYILQSNSGAIVKVYNFEPSPKLLDRDYYEYLGDYAISKDIKDGIASINCTLYRWHPHLGMSHWNGLKEDSFYNWKKAE